MKDNPIAVSLHFDSLSEAYGFPSKYCDPSYFAAFERINKLSQNYKLPLSIFIIGRDLENKENFKQVRDWSQQGHEIGNHSWSHFAHFGSLPINELKDEIKKSHYLIAECIGHEPKGFISPLWSSSKDLIRTLIDLNYAYDTPRVSFHAILSNDTENNVEPC